MKAEDFLRGGEHKTVHKILNGHAKRKIKLNARKLKSSDVENDRSCYKRSFLKPQKEVRPRGREMIEEFGHCINPEPQENDKNLSEEIFQETTSRYIKN